MQTTATLNDRLAHYNRLVHEEIQRVLDTRPASDAFFGMMRYHLGLVDERLQPVAAPQGKRLRGALLMLLSEACGGDEDAAAPLAAGMELLHNFSLVHDDIQDGSPTRRHRPTVWSVWGTPLGINVGDGLHVLAHLALLNSSLCRTAPARFVDILGRFEQAAVQLCEGQHLDMLFEQRSTVSVDEYLTMIGGKAAALIAATAAIGACAGGATEQQIGIAERFGHDLGMAFQMQDDILGIWGDEALTGKSTISDIASRKKTLPVLLAMSGAAPADRARLHDLYTHPRRDEPVPPDMMPLLEKTGARGLVDEYLHRYWDAAMHSLRALRRPAAVQERLEEFARLCIERVA